MPLGPTDKYVDSKSDVRHVPAVLMLHVTTEMQRDYSAPAPVIRMRPSAWLLTLVMIILGSEGKTFPIHPAAMTRSSPQTRSGTKSGTITTDILFAYAKASISRFERYPMMALNGGTSQLLGDEGQNKLDAICLYDSELTANKGFSHARLELVCRLMSPRNNDSSSSSAIADTQGAVPSTFTMRTLRNAGRTAGALSCLHASRSDSAPPVHNSNSSTAFSLPRKAHSADLICFLQSSSSSGRVSRMSLRVVAAPRRSHNEAIWTIGV